MNLRKSNSEPRVSEKIWICFSISVFVMVLASFFPILKKPVEDLICEKEIVIVYVRASRSKQTNAFTERMICPEEGSIIYAGEVKGKSHDVTILYYVGSILFYGSIFFAVISIWSLLPSNRHKNKS